MTTSPHMATFEQRVTNANVPGQVNSLPLPPPSEEMLQKQNVEKQNVEKQNVEKQCIQFKKEHPPPIIAPATIIEEGPPMLLRQCAHSVAPYNIFQIIKDIKIDHRDYKNRFIKELARNHILRKQLETNNWFDEWIEQSKNFITPTNYTAKY